MKKTSKVLSLSLAFALGLPVIGGLSGHAVTSVTYASEETYSYKNTVKNHVNKDQGFRKTDAFSKANDAEKKIYDVAINYGKELLEKSDATDSEFKSAAEEIRKAKDQINDTSNPYEDKAKHRVKLRLTMITAKDFLFKVPKQDYNKKEYDNLSREYGKAQLLYEDAYAEDYEYILQTSKLEDAIKEFDINNNAKAQRLRLQQAYEANKLQAQVARDLLKNYPKTVAKVKGQLEIMLKNSEKLQKEAEKALGL